MVMMAALTLILLVQEWIVRRKRLWLVLRMGYLALTLVWLGWILNGQLSVVQVVAFVQALLSGFRWETFLIEPVIFTLWSGVALGLLFWGRGVFCGWLCPFGAAQELLNQAARRLGIPQIAVPHIIHGRALHRALLLPLSVPAWRGAGASGQAQDLRLAAPAPAMRPRMPAVRDQMHGRRDRPAGADKSQ